MDNINRWQRVRALFEDLVEHDAATRAARLAALASDQPELAAEVASLLEADGGAGGGATALQEAMPDLFDDLADSERQQQQPRWEGRLLGPWRLLREIGRGGMGTVHLAERADGAFEQRVAVKLVRAGWDVDELQVRFRIERKILASLNHPHIARLLDGGVTDEGLPWLALEFVDGLTLTRWCDQQRLTIQQRLRMFVDVCEAVAHAHERLVVHRDLKPSNILVSHDGRVKLLDFGIAKLLADDGARALTEPAQRLLTPEYASPEQLRGELVTTASDIHALGLLLFELLTGRRAYRITATGARAWEHAILEQEPWRPSQRAVQPTPDPSDSEPVTGEEIAQRRQLAPEQLRRELSGDLDAIILKALRKDPRERYANVREMSEDIRAHLECRPVRARRASTRYRVSRLLKRHALAASLATLAILALVGGTAVSLWQADQARSQRDLAVAEAGKAAALRDFMLDVFRRADPARAEGSNLSARDLLDTAAARVEHLELETLAQADLLQAIAEAYFGIAMPERAEPLLERVLALRRAAQADTAAEVDAMVLLARIEKGRGELERSMETLERAERMLTPGQDSHSWAQLWMARGIAELALRRLPDAIADFERGSEGLMEVRGEMDDLALDARAMLAWAYDAAERYDDVERLIAPLLQQARNNPAANPVHLANLLDAYANARSARGDHAQAIELGREALQLTRQVYGDGHRFVGSRLNNLAFRLQAGQRLREAADAMRESLALARQHLPSGAHSIGSSASNLARIEMELGEYESAETHILEGIAIREQREDKTDLSYALVTAAGIARGAGHPALAAERLALARHWFDAMPNKPDRLLLRLFVEQAEQDLSRADEAGCRGSDEAMALRGRQTLSGDAATIAWVELIAQACAARAGAPDAAAALDQRLQSALQLLDPESERRAQAKAYVDTARRRR